MHLATVIISTFDILEGDARYRRLIGKPRRGFEGLLIGLLLIQHVPRVSSRTLNMRSRIVVSIAGSTRLQLYVCMHIQYILVAQAHNIGTYILIICANSIYSIVLLIFLLYALYLKNEGFTKKLNWQKYFVKISVFIFPE